MRAAHQDSGLHQGQVICNHGIHIIVEDSQAQLHHCVARKKAGGVICGDQVMWAPSAQGHAKVIRILPRSSLLSRPDPRGRLMKHLCANIDRLIIVNALSPNTAEPINLALLDRYLVAAELSGITPLILLHKTDLATGDTHHKLENCLACYRKIGYSLVYSSTKTREGIAELSKYLSAHKAVLTGESGAGKSSLIKTLIPEQAIRVGALSLVSGKGRHTTTATTLYHLPQGGDIIDSPGVRDFGLWHADPKRLQEGFREFRPFLGHCRFRDCRHLGEPGCAIATAQTDGQIAAARLARYREIRCSLR